MLDLKQLTFLVDLRLKDWGWGRIREINGECKGAPSCSAFLIKRDMTSHASTELVSSQIEEVGKIITQMREAKIKNIELIVRRYTYDRSADVGANKAAMDNSAFAKEARMSLPAYNIAIRDLKILIGIKLVENGSLKLFNRAACC